MKTTQCPLKSCPGWAGTTLPAHFRLLCSEKATQRAGPFPLLHVSSLFCSGRSEESLERESTKNQDIHCHSKPTHRQAKATLTRPCMPRQGSHQGPRGCSRLRTQQAGPPSSSLLHLPDPQSKSRRPACTGARKSLGHGIHCPCPPWIQPHARDPSSPERRQPFWAGATAAGDRYGQLRPPRALDIGLGPAPRPWLHPLHSQPPPWAQRSMQ